MALSITGIISTLQKLQQVVGDAPVILKSVEGAVETEIKSIGLTLTPEGDAAGSPVTLDHGPVEPTQEPAPSDPPATVGGEQVQPPAAG